MNIEEFKQMKAEFEELVATSGKAMLVAGFKSLFDQFPYLLAVRWTQYTPYFNDGEPCVFGVNSVYYKLEGRPEDAGDYGDGFEDGIYLGTAESDEERHELERQRERLQAVRRVADAGLFSDAMESVFHPIFGDGVRVTVGRDLEFEIEEYEHE